MQQLAVLGVEYICFQSSSKGFNHDAKNASSGRLASAPGTVTYTSVISDGANRCSFTGIRFMGQILSVYQNLAPEKNLSKNGAKMRRLLLFIQRVVRICNLLFLTW